MGAPGATRPWPRRPGCVWPCRGGGVPRAGRRSAVRTAVAVPGGVRLMAEGTEGAEAAALLARLVRCESPGAV
ncbi:hypothetical protein AB0E16_21925, partial [Streptomyces sp. NPDC047970]|uniref:hypothetical protein n=1 Tax=Streptomyces sp. NPDC047970 TaxID=3155481 RepID=UPI0034276D8C